MTIEIESLSRWAASLPLFDGALPNLMPVSASSGGALFTAEWPGGKAALKLFADGGESRPLALRAANRARAAAEGLRIFAPQGIAPALLWEGSLPGENTGTFAVVYRWVEDTGTLPLTMLNDAEAELYVDTLLRVHNEETPLKLLSPNPRNLEDWWLKTHEQYRDLEPQLAVGLPPSVYDTLARLIQSVAGDAQTHKRFWRGTPLRAVHGEPLSQNVVLDADRTHMTLVSWQRFGLGDPAYEIASAIRQWDTPTAEALTARYLAGVEDPAMGLRVEIYRRVLPFSSIVTTLSAAGKREGGWESSIVEDLHVCLETYGWSAPAISSTLRDMQEWGAGQPGTAGS